MMRGIVCILTAVLLLGSPARTAAQSTPANVGAPAPQLTMSEVERLAGERHPAIREAMARVDEARGMARQDGTKPNPIAGVLTDELGTGDGHPAGQFGVFVEQSVPLRGRLAAARVAGEALVTLREGELQVVRRQVQAEARARYVEAAAALDRLAQREAMVMLATESVDIAGKLFNVGLVDRADVLDSEAAAAEQRLHRDEARAAVEAAWARLTLSTGGPAFDRARAPALETTLPELVHDAARTRVITESPWLESARHELARQRALVRLAGRGTWPELSLKGEAWFDRERAASGRARGWGFGAEAGVRVPLFDRNTGNILAATAGVRAAEAALEHRQLQVDLAFVRAWQGYASALARVKTLEKDVLPRAEESHRLYLANFQQMASPYPQVLVAQERVIRLREELVNAREALWLTWVQLDTLVVGG